jgi:hypothetical protein
MGNTIGTTSGAGITHSFKAYSVMVCVVPLLVFSVQYLRNVYSTWLWRCTRHGRYDMYERQNCMNNSFYYEECSTNCRGRYDIYERQHCMNTSLHWEECSNNTRGRHDMYDKQHFMNTSLYCEVWSNNFRRRYDVTCRKDNTSWTRHFISYMSYLPLQLVEHSS